MEKFSELYKQVISEGVEIELRNSKKKKLLVDIILNKTELDDKSKVKRIREILLEFQQEICVNMEKNSVDASTTIPILGEKLSKLDVNQIRNLTDTMNIIYEPIQNHNKMTDAITQVIRSDLTDERKIEKITDILL